MLSNKLTFSLALVVMLALGLGLMAMPADAIKYTIGEGDGVTWIDYPVAEDPVEFTTDSNGDGTADDPGIVPITPKITADTDGIEGITISNSATITSVAISAIQSDGTTAARTIRTTAFVRYTFTIVRSATDNSATNDVDEGIITLTIADYSPVTITSTQWTAGATGNFVKPTPQNTVDFSLNPSVSRFHIVYNENATENDDGTALSNGIRIGDGYVSRDAITAVALPDLAALFNQGGTIKLIGSGAVITEVMWGYDVDAGSGAPITDNQWIEVYYQTGEAEATAPEGTVALQLQFIYGQFDDSGADEVSNLYLSRWAPKGQSGRSHFSRVDGSAPIPLISMHRKRATIIGTIADSQYDTEKKFATGGDQIGYLPGSWDASQTAKNMSGSFIGTPGAAHLPPIVGGGHADYAENKIPGSPLQFSEIRNDKSADDVDWIEIRNVTDNPVNLKDYEISGITGVSRRNLFAERGYHKTDPRWEAKEHDKAIVGFDNFDDKANFVDPKDANNDVKRFPDWMLPGKAYLVITNKDPEDTILAGGKDIEVLADRDTDNKITNKGSDVYYFVTPSLNGRLDAANLLLVMRNRVDRNEFDGKVHGDGASIIDLAGSGRHADPSAIFNTEVWPLRGWKNPGGSWNIAGGGVRNFVEGGNHEWWKHKGSANPGVGYDKGTPTRLAVGTPGYPDNVVKDKLIDHKGTPATTDDVTLLMGNISFSEIMLDASVHAGNERWNLVQWIELYNSSMTEAINLQGWELEIRNSNDHVDSFVDSSFTFKHLIVPPNQTVLLVSARAASGGIADRQVYNLYTNHAGDIGLANRRANLLSPAGFYLRLSYVANDGQNTKIIVDEAGNVDISNRRARVTNEWDTIPPSEGPVRRSLVRQYGTRAEDGNGPDLPAVGTMEEAWILADLDGEGSTYYGQRGDIATPGFRLGGPLPVSLSSFRPVRDKATGAVVIRWITQSELNNAGFNILRSETKNGDFKVVNLKGLIAGHGTTSEKHVYEWKDTTAKPNVVYYYQIEDVSFEGQHTTLATTHLRGNVNAAGKLTTTWGDLKTQ